MVVPWNRKHYFSATSPVRIRSLVWILHKDFLKTPHFFFSHVLRQALFSFTIQAHIKAGISSNLFVNDVVTTIWFFPELCKAPWGSVTLPKVTCQCVTRAWDGTASPPGTAELASLFLGQVFSVSDMLFRSSLSRVGT